MQKITPCLWFDDQAEEAAKFYTSLFKGSRVLGKSRYGKEGFEVHGRPAGSVLTVEFELAGQGFTALNGGPLFRFNPAISLRVACKTRREVDALWAKLSKGGKVLMELGQYPFSPRYGWTCDRYGLSWQLMAVDGEKAGQRITPMLLFVGERCGKAEEAVKFYASAFKRSKLGKLERYAKGEAPDAPGTLKQAAFTLEGRNLAAMDSAHEHRFAFNEAVSFQVYCKDQKEADGYWTKLSKGGDKAAQQCGWLKDRYGVSWTIVPAFLREAMCRGGLAETDRIMKALLPMKKLDFAALKKAAKG